MGLIVLLFCFQVKCKRSSRESAANWDGRTRGEKTSVYHGSHQQTRWVLGLMTRCGFLCRGESLGVTLGDSSLGVWGRAFSTLFPQFLSPLFFLIPKFPFELPAEAEGEGPSSDRQKRIIGQTKHGDNEHAWSRLEKIQTIMNDWRTLMLQA